MKMSKSELNADSSEQSSEDLTPVETKDSSALGERPAPKQIDFTRWREEPLPPQAASMVGHRRVIKSREVHQSEPIKITHDIDVTLEPEPEPRSESVEITPLKEGDTIIGLLLTCGCGATHEVRFDYGEEE